MFSISFAPSGVNCKSQTSPASTGGFSPFHDFTTKTSPVTNRKRLSKSLSANPKFSEGIETCRNELVLKHCEICISLSNSWVASDKSRLPQARRSRDCSSWMKLSSYSSHKISRTTFSGGNTPERYSLPCQTIGPIKPLRLSTPGYIWVSGNITSNASWRRRADLVPFFSVTLLSIERNVRHDWFDNARDGSFATRISQASRTRSHEPTYFAAVAGWMKRPGSGNT